MITISAFKWVPEFAQGQVRDLRARWALEEAGLPYKSRLLELGIRTSRTIARFSLSVRCRSLRRTTLCFRIRGHRAACRRTERGAAAQDASARARAMQWLVAALNSIEPFV